ncbi:MAG: hypothetical protein ACOVOV_10835 [Dolichospermum sp.]|jgi:hypothetical protein
MSNQVIQSDLIVDLSTEEQEILAGGNSQLCPEKGGGSPNKGGKDGGFSPSEKNEDDKPNNGNDGDGSKYNFLINRPIFYRPTYNVKL